MKKLFFLSFIVFSICAEAQVRVSFAYNYPTLPGSSQDSVLNGLNSIRGCYFDSNLEGDGKSAIAVTNYKDQGHVHIFSCVGNDSLQLVWTSPKLDFGGGSSTPRYVMFGDLDNDGRKEVIFQSYSNGILIFEHDGIPGSHNFGTTPSQVIGSDYLNNVVGNCEYMEISDVDGDNENELLVAYNASSNITDTYYSISAVGVWSTNDPGFSSFNVEFKGVRTNLSKWGLGSSPVAMIAANLDGTGNKEIILHDWNLKNVTPMTVPSANTYVLADTTNNKQNIFLAGASDDVALFGGMAYDIDKDGRDEVYLPTYFSSGSPFAGFVHMISYDQGQSTSQIDESNTFALNLNSISPSPLQILGYGFGDIDNDGKPNLYFSGSNLSDGYFPINVVISAEFQGGDKRDQNNWEISVLYPGDSTIYKSFTIKDSLGYIDTLNKVIDASFVSKMFAKNTDVDKDGKEDLVLVYQALSDSISITKLNWNSFTGNYESTNYQEINPKRWSLRILEAGYSAPPPNITWNAGISISSGTNNNQLTYGLASSATNGIDVSLGEVELPPIPPSGIFDARFELPTTPPVSSLKDYRNDTLKTATWVMKFQPGDVGYPFTFAWNPALLTSIGSFFLKDLVTGTIVNINMTTDSSYTLTNSGITSLKIEYKKEICKEVQFNSDWNIVSIPVQRTDMEKASLFATAVSSAFWYNNGYEIKDTLATGKGYWLKFNASGSINVCGEKVTPSTVAVTSGWNLIGGYENDIATNSITTTPSGIISSVFYGYNNGYHIPSTLLSGKGYWIKVIQYGVLNLPSTLPKATAPENNFASDWGKIIVTDTGGKSMTLYLAAVGNSNLYELPPVPPVGIYDVRFTTDRMVEGLNSTEKMIDITSAEYPVKIRVEKVSLVISDKVTGKLVNRTLKDGEELTIENAGINKLAVSTVEVPTEYSLSQNYPNPFNPVTIIAYQLPKAGIVTLKLYDVLGSEVRTLVNEQKESGSYQVELKAAELASGTYLYRLTVNDFVQVKKLVILK